MSDLRVVPPYNRRPLPEKVSADVRMWLRVAWALLTVGLRRR